LHHRSKPQRIIIIMQQQDRQQEEEETNFRVPRRAPVDNAESFGTGATAPTETDGLDEEDEVSGSVSSDPEVVNPPITAATEATTFNATEPSSSSLTAKLEAGSFGAAAISTKQNGPVDLDETVVTTASMMDLSIIAKNGNHPTATTATTPMPSLLGGNLDTSSQQHDQQLEDSLMYSPDGKTTVNQQQQPQEESKLEPFINHGLQQWEAARKVWLHRPQLQQKQQQQQQNVVVVRNKNRNDNDQDSEAPPPPQPRAVPLDVDEIIDILFLSTSAAARASTATTTHNNNKANGPTRFPQNVALPQMVDILQDLWEAEGLDA